MKQGQKTGNKQFRIYYLKKEEQCAKIGISISKKKGNAVARNYIKRQIKVMMTSIIEFEKFTYDLVIIPTTHYQSNQFQDNLEKMKTIIKNLEGN